jgi:hypothetical protein
VRVTAPAASSALVIRRWQTGRESEQPEDRLRKLQAPVTWSVRNSLDNLINRFGLIVLAGLTVRLVTPGRLSSPVV